MTLETTLLPDTMDVLAPDGSEIRLLVRTAKASMVHCLLPAGAVTQAVRHRQVEEVWYCMAGEGELWRKQGAQETVVALVPGQSLAIPVGVTFQFRTTGDDALVVLIVTLPPWPGPEEAIPCQCRWEPCSQSNHPSSRNGSMS